MRLAAIWLGKLVELMTRTFRTGGGSAAPGYYALKLDKNLLEKFSKQLPKAVIVTGTNGKTTTAKMIAKIARNEGLKVLTNPTGSNLERGILSVLISKCDVWGRLPKYDLAVWELDEAAFCGTVVKLNPGAVLFLNIYRDQMDRYGEIDTLVKKWEKTVRGLPTSVQVIVNGDEKKLMAIERDAVVRFGVENYKIEGEKVVYEKEVENLDFEAKKVNFMGLSGSEFVVGGEIYKLPLPGVYNVYNGLAAVALAGSLGWKNENVKKALSQFGAAFGRVEKMDLGSGKEGWCFLIKNPVGATQVFKTVEKEIGSEDIILAALNDKLADGTDVSWIWDAQWETLANNVSKKIIVSGARAYDLALRLKYAGFDVEKIEVVEKIEQGLEMAISLTDKKLIMLPTYTAMLEIQKIMAKRGIISHYWKNE
jgi:lipid II isoglutaminyl synthase (glutamine-hydrolysing)